MMAGTIASLLTDFSPPAAKEAPGIEIRKTFKVTEEKAPEPQQPVADRQAELIKAAEAKIRSEEREASSRQIEEAIASERARWEDELSVQRKIWVEQEAAQLSTQMVEALMRIETILADRVANILRPFVSEAFHKQSISELKDILTTLLIRGEARLMEITGPEDVLQALKANLGAHKGTIEFISGDHVEISVAAHDTTVQTQLDPWATRLKQALKAE